MIDLSKLEAGDMVEINGELLPVIKIIFCPKDHIVEYDLYKVFVLDDSDNRYSDWCYRIDGSFLFGFHPITKVVNRWTDKDMKDAFNQGNQYARFTVDDEIENKWLKQYKVGKK